MQGMVAGVFALWCFLPMRQLKSLRLETIIGKLSSTFRKIADSRTVARVKYCLHDTGERFCDNVFSAPEPSLVPEADGATSEGGAISIRSSWVEAVPSDTRMREVWMVLRWKRFAGYCQRCLDLSDALARANQYDG
jgi:hypothetical protein